MIARLAWAELRQQVCSRVFWIVFAVSVLMVCGAMLIDELRIGLVERGLARAPKLSSAPTSSGPCSSSSLPRRW